MALSESANPDGLLISFERYVLAVPDRLALFRYLRSQPRAVEILKEIVGFDNKLCLTVPNSVARKEREREIETKLILSSDIGQWNVAENFIGTKNVNGGPWEFGYAAGVSP